MNKLIGDRAFYSYMFKLAIPIALQTVLMAAFQLIDASMVAKLGNEAMAGVNMAGRWTFILMITLFGIGSGCSILYSQYWGVKDEAGIRRVFGMSLMHMLGVAVIMSLVMALFPRQLITVFAGGAKPEIVEYGTQYMQLIAFNCLFFAFNYAVTAVLRSTEEVHIPLFTSLVAICVNTGLNYILIYGHFGAPALGVRGAAIATIVSSAVQTVLLVVQSRWRRHIAFIHIRQWFDFSRALLFKVYKVVAPVLANEVLWVLGNSVYLMVFGRMVVQGSTAAVPAAYSLYGSIDQLLFAFIIGLSSACGVIVGKSVGEGDTEGAWRSAVRFVAFGTAFACLLGLAEALLRVPVVNLIGPEALAADLTKKILLMGSIAMPLKMLAMLFIVAIFRAGGRPEVGAVLDVACVWFIGAPLVLLGGLVWHWDFTMVFPLIFAEDIFKVGIGLVLFLRRKWIRRLTDDDVTMLPSAVPEPAEQP